MPVSHRTLPEHALVHVLCSGSVTVAETQNALQAYARDPDSAPGQSLLIDLTNVTAYERDFPKIMSLQAQQAEVYLRSDTKVHLIYIAPNKLTQSMAMAALRSWKSLDGVIPLLVATLPEALDVLGLSQQEFVGSGIPAQ